MNLNAYIERRGTDCCKWDDYVDMFPGMDVSDAVPMWVADMDFCCPPEVVDAVVKRAQEGLYGYNVGQTEGYENSTVGWLKKRYGWAVDREWIVFTPGVVPALSHAIRALTEPGDGVIIQPPVYYPFRKGVENNGRVVRSNSLILDGDTYRMNFEQLEELAAEPRTRLMILCSPHNPVGRVWSREELEKVCTICRRHGVTLVSDEIHADLLMRGVAFTATGPVAQACGADCISCYAPSKTFNMAGLQSSAIIISNPEIRAKFRRQLAKSSLPGMNVFAGVALEAAWTYGEPYIKEVMEYIEANIDYAIEFAERYTPKVKIRKPQGTYLVWVDLRGLGLNTEQAERFFVERAKIAVDLGTWFGPGGAGFVRMNFACRRSTLGKALEQLRTAYEKEFA